jgi:hypothetical protein
VRDMGGVDKLPWLSVSWVPESFALGKPADKIAVS